MNKIQKKISLFSEICSSLNNKFPPIEILDDYFEQQISQSDVLRLNVFQLNNCLHKVIDLENCCDCDITDENKNRSVFHELEELKLILLQISESEKMKTLRTSLSKPNFIESNKKIRTLLKKINIDNIDDSTIEKIKDIYREDQNLHDITNLSEEIYRFYKPTIDQSKYQYLKIVEKLISMSKNENIQVIIDTIRKKIGKDTPLTEILKYVKFRKFTELPLIVQQQI